MTNLKTDAEELLSDKDWTNITGSVTYTFLSPAYLPSYMLDGSGGLVEYMEDFMVDDETEVSAFSLSQRRITHFYLSSVDDLVGTGNTNVKNLDSEYFTTISNSGENYRNSFSDVANISFEENLHAMSAPNDVGDIALSTVTHLNSAIFATTYLPEVDGGGDVQIGSVDGNTSDGDFLSDFGAGEQGSWVIFHELGHSVGLYDALETFMPDGDQDTSDDYLNNQKYTIMSYNSYQGLLDGSDFLRPSGLQILDIWALQQTYGANTSVRSGDTTYALGKGFGFFSDPNNLPANAEDEAFIYTIWDGDGIDKIDASAFDVRAEIDLRQGRFSSIGRNAVGAQWSGDSSATGADPDPGNVAIAYDTWIENAKGTTLGDTIFGNALNNEIDGNGGSDKLYGYSGDDKIISSISNSSTTITADLAPESRSIF